MKTILLSVLGVALFSLTVAAQDTPQPDDGPVVEKKAVVIIEEDDGGDDGPKVIILGGDDLEGFDMDMDMDMSGVHEKMKLKLRDGDETMEFNFDLGGDGHGDMPKKVREMIKKRMKDMGGFKGLKDMEDLLDPERRGAWIESMKARAKESRKAAREAKLERDRDGAIKALELDDETAAVVVPFLDAVLKTQSRIKREDSARRKALRKGPQDDAALRPKLDALRAASKKDASDLVTARNDLRQLLTLGQEIELVLRGVLN